MAKKRRKRKKKMKAGKKAAIITSIILLFFAVIAVIVIMNWKTIVHKAEDLLPSAFTYPTEYEQYVTKYAKEYGVEPALIYAVIKTESGFDNYAVSEVGARGLMQMTEETFDWIRTKIGGTETFDDLYQPEVSIHYGTYLLNYLLDEFDGDVDTAMSAYHAGSASVRSWLKNPANSEDGRRLNHIPKADTEHYVNKINRAIGIYERRTAAE